MDWIVLFKVLHTFIPSLQYCFQRMAALAVAALIISDALHSLAIEVLLGLPLYLEVELFLVVLIASNEKSLVSKKLLLIAIVLLVFVVVPDAFWKLFEI